nr:unnamed protein product [Callosobruchus analis]
MYGITILTYTPNDLKVPLVTWPVILTENTKKTLSLSVSWVRIFIGSQFRGAESFQMDIVMSLIKKA